MNQEQNQERESVPENLDEWLKDKTVPIPFIPIEAKLVEAVNAWIRKHPGVELPADFVVSHYAKIVCETPRTLSEHRGDDK